MVNSDNLQVVGQTLILSGRRVPVMKKIKKSTPIYSLIILFLLILAVGCAASGSKTGEQSSEAVSSQVAVKEPMEIAENVSCGKCGMYPANYPRWHTQIIFKDDVMTAFDGCKCMFNFLFAIEKFDKIHSRNDVAVAWVKDFDSGKWLNAEDAYYVVGSDMMGPMGKELIPFADQAAAMKFNQEQGGTMMKYAEITPEVLETLEMGSMKMEHGQIK
jgi:copper chaperone NosL